MRDRSNIVHLDGTRIFQTAEDLRGQSEVADAISAAWNCELHSFGALAPIDWYALRYGRMVGVLELKGRDYGFDQYPTIFISVRKWLALTLAATALGTPAIFVAKFSDGIWWVPLADIDTSHITITGWSKPRARNDTEPLIRIPTSQLRPLKGEG